MDLISIISNNYLMKVNNIEKNQDSTDGNVYIIKSEKKYVLKIYDNERHANNMVLIHEFLINNNFNVPKIIKSKEDNSYIKYNNQYFVVYTFLDGKQLSKLDNISDNIIVNFAKKLRKFHDITSTCDFNLDKVYFCDYNNSRLSLLHFDLTKDNIFSNNDEIGFIDFDDAKYGPSLCDVAIAICLLFISKKRGVDLEKIRLFLNAYYNEDLNLKEKEIVFMKKYAISWIDYLNDGHEFDTSTKESFNFKKQILLENDIFNL